MEYIKRNAVYFFLGFSLMSIFDYLTKGDAVNLYCVSFAVPITLLLLVIKLANRNKKTSLPTSTIPTPHIEPKDKENI